MDRVLNPKNEKQTIYEIYRACRLCGAGAGYKMPIIQNVVELDGDGIELKQKIKECVQIEVSHTDRMPPLICELCVDKVNDFYQFLDMCRQNNKRTRQKLGLPLHTPTRDSADSENCILGVTEPVFTDSDAEERNKNKNKKKTKVKKETEVKIKSEPRPSFPRAPSRESSEPRCTVMFRGKPRPAPTAELKRATRTSLEPLLEPAEDMVELERKLKRAREKEMNIETPPPSKKTKTIPEPLKIPVSKSKIQKEPPKIQKEPPKVQKESPKVQKEPPKTLKESPKTKPQPKSVKNRKSPPKVIPESPKVNIKPHSKPKAKEPTRLNCPICKVHTKTITGLFQHQQIKHIPAFTSPKNACNACELWFVTTEAAVAHHKHHRTQNVPYKCTRCYGYFEMQQAYEDHFGHGECLSEYEVPDVQCAVCWRAFPTARLHDQHKCMGAQARPGGKCAKCNRSYALLKNLVKHESTCSYKVKEDVKEPEERPDLLPMKVVIARCDPLLSSGALVSCGALSQNYGLDPSRRYPYLRARIKTEPPMVAIHDIKLEFTSKVDTLSAICLRILQAKKLKDEPEFEDITANIDRIIENLANEDTQTSCGSDSILNKDRNSVKDDSKTKNVDSESKDNEFDSIFDKNDANSDSSVKDVDSKTKNDDSESKDDGFDSILSKNDSYNDFSMKDVDSKPKDDDSNIIVSKNDATESKDDANEDTEVNCVRENGEVNVNSSKGGGFDSLDAESVKDKELLVNDSISNASESLNHDKPNENHDDSLRNDSCSANNTDTLNNDIGTASSDVTNNDNVDSLDHNKVTDSLSDGTEGENVQSNVDNENIEELRTENSPTDSSKNEKVDSIDNSNGNELTNLAQEMEVDENKDSKNDKVDSIDSFNGYELTNHTEMEVDENKDYENVTSYTENIENFSKIDEITNKILEDGEKISDSDVKSLRPSENGVETLDKFNVNDLSEDDRKLMAELDEHIGENLNDDQKINENEQRDNQGDNNEQRIECDQIINENEQRDIQGDNNDQRLDCGQIINENEHRDNQRDNNEQIIECDQIISENEQRDIQGDNNDQRLDCDQIINENEHRDNQRDNNDQIISENDQTDIQGDNNDQRLDCDQIINENEHRDNQGDNNEQRVDCDQRLTDTEKYDEKVTDNERDFEKQNIEENITENDEKITHNSKNHYIDELLKKQDSSLRSLDLDSISDDEFNFDI